MFQKTIFLTRTVRIRVMPLLFIIWLLPGFVLDGTQIAYGQNAPYPQSPVITSLVWDAQVLRDGQGSDGWPTTWADDDKLYTAWADGFGFAGNDGIKLSLGFSKVTGTAQSFTGIDIDSPSGEEIGDGSSGKKASGMLMVNNTLYMWVRNANNNGQHCQLAQSTNQGATWSWSNWKFTEFGFCSFINFGKNYAGARDTYVYMVTHNNSSAYVVSDHMILTRVPQSQIMNRNAYEFFNGIQNGGPTWTSAISQRQPVFTNPAQCLRSGISYNAALGRYLWWQHLPGQNFDTRFSGGFGIYDAPEPWGPWTTTYFTAQWDVGPGELGHFPTKWMSSDGKTAHLVFSGNDAFSVRKATFTLQGGGGGDTTPPDAPANLQGQPVN